MKAQYIFDRCYYEPGMELKPDPPKSCLPVFRLEAGSVVLPPLRRRPPGPQTGVLPRFPLDLGFDLLSSFSTPPQRFPFVPLYRSYRTGLLRPFPDSLTTTPLKRSSRRRFEASTCLAAPGATPIFHAAR